jgi:hypothetical protein
MSKKNVLTIRVPEDLKIKLEKTARSQGVSLNQFALYAFTRGLSDIDTTSYFKDLIEGKEADTVLSNFDKLMGKVQSRKTKKWDES